MIKLIIGNKGSGKTKKLIDAVNEAAKNSPGNVVCIEKGDSLRFSVSSEVRLIDTESYIFSTAAWVEAAVLFAMHKGTGFVDSARVLYYNIRVSLWVIVGIFWKMRILKDFSGNTGAAL